MGAGTNPNVNPVFSLLQAPPTELLVRIKKTLSRRGCYGIWGLR